ncbi:Dcp1p-Dcp2p decapping enzyme complex alpha subunit [Kickxella alabastrina]|uniref:Dcp1p-Dcp2p decapping enzyme complex alpha subunit n=1 Tax=Kickxella alabastrina TaxID=61397 RepID=A0ACC1IJV1_9FUNG|nr:Dcp1p-Dcp2p decapping enzyme complex alpha subunit [Kickxella alabastrina]
MQRDLEKRLGFLRDHIVGPFRAARRHDNPKAARLVPVVAEVKLFERSYGVQKVYDQIIPRLYHKSDGLIFTAVKAPYMPGTCNTIVKWKPAGENSIDFKIRVTRNSSNAPELQLHQWLGGDNYELFGIMAVRPDDWATHFADLARLDGRIAETIYDPEYSPPAVWRFLRFRDDKPHGNHASVIQRIIASIGDTMDLDELVNVMVQVRDNWKSRNPGS